MANVSLEPVRQCVYRIVAAQTRTSDRELLRQFAEQGDEVDGLRVKLQPLGVVTGLPLDLDGEPLAGGRIIGSVDAGQLNITKGWLGFFHAEANKDGRFRVEVIPGVRVGPTWSPAGSERATGYLTRSFSRQLKFATSAT
jgi:hypothetical protein